MGVNSLLKTVTRPHHDYNLNPGPSVPESSTLTTEPPKWSSSTNNLEFNQVKTDVPICVQCVRLRHCHNIKSALSSTRSQLQARSENAFPEHACTHIHKHRQTNNLTIWLQLLDGWRHTNAQCKQIISQKNYVYGIQIGLAGMLCNRFGLVWVEFIAPPDTI